MVSDALQRFATGTYAVWYPIIPRPEAHDLPKRLKTLAQRADRPWLRQIEPEHYVAWHLYE